MLWRFPLPVSLLLLGVVAERSAEDVCVCDCSRCSQFNNQIITTAATKYEAPRENHIALRYDSQNPQLGEARRLPDSLPRGSTLFEGFSNQPEKINEERRADIGGLLSNTNYQNMYSAYAGGGQNTNGFNKFTNVEGARKQSETVRMAAPEHDSQIPTLTGASRQQDLLSRGPTSFRGYPNEPEKINKEKSADIGRLVSNTNYQNKYSADAGGGENTNGINKPTNAQGVGRESEIEATAGTKYEAPKENHNAPRYDSQNPQLTRDSQQQNLLSRDSTPFRGYLNEPEKIKEERRADIGRLVPNADHQNMHSADAGGGEYKNGFNKFSNAEGDGRESEPFFNSLIERVAVELSNSLEAELRALQRDRVHTERLRNARMQHAAVVAVTRLDNAFTQLAKSPVGVDTVIEKIMNSVRRNIRQTGTGFEQSCKEKALQNIPILMKITMKTIL